MVCPRCGHNDCEFWEGPSLSLMFFCEDEENFHDAVKEEEEIRVDIVPTVNRCKKCRQIFLSIEDVAVLKESFELTINEWVNENEEAAHLADPPFCPIFMRFISGEGE